MVPLQPPQDQGPLLARGPVLGTHGDIRPGYLPALEEAEALGCGALQILPYRRRHEPTAEELAGFRSALERSTVRRLIVHARYLPYLASSDPAQRARSVAGLARELKLAAALGAEGFIVHVGAYSPGAAAEEGLARFCRSLAEGAEGSAVPVWIENVPGGGRRLGGPLEDLARTLAASPAAGVCLDTAHAFAHGYDLRGGLGPFLDEAERVLGPGRLKALHLNDTHAERGSHLESHADWGTGRLAGALALTEPGRLAGVPCIIETPTWRDRENLEFVRKAWGLEP